MNLDDTSLVAVLIVLRWIWLLMSLISFGGGWVAWREAHADQAALRRLANFDPEGPRALIATKLILTTIVRLRIQTVFILLGLASVTAPAPLVIHNQWVSILSSGIFLFINALLLWDAIQERYYRGRINERIDSLLHTRAQEQRWRPTKFLARVLPPHIGADDEDSDHA